jgi:hypothetical protein
MKAYQVLMYGQLDEVDYETTLNLAVVPNPVFLSLAGASAFVLEDINTLRTEGNEGLPEGDHAPVLAEVPWKPLVKTSSSLFDPNLCYFFDDHTGVTYEIAEIEINP